ncbi:DUF4179 domain-containing protein [Virgibacillus doumboii]|uniref:DUF4179 domain-containing protein n=1 Tax=Virgibacillus doumboii TaxID=2697503 RepID=UPI0013DE98DC|nr:DUF4179 domain-containing protein [Virgibacillus doumboii]
MSKLSRKDFDDYIGKDSFYSEQDKERFFKRLRQSERKKKNWFPQLMTAAIALLILFAGMQFIQNGLPFQSAGDKDYGAWKVADSKEEVTAYFKSRTPGLELAEEKGLVSEINKSIPLEGKSDLKIEKIWYNSEEIFVFYSIGIPNPEIMKNQETAPHITQFYVQSDENGQYPNQNLSVYAKQTGPQDGIIYNDRFYHRATMMPIRDQSHNVISQIDDIITAIITVNLFNESQDTQEVKLPINFDQSEETVASSSIDKTIHAGNASLTIDRIEMRVSQTVLYGSIDTPNGNALQRINGSVITKDAKGNEDPTSFSMPASSPTSFKLEFRPMNSMPENITVKIDSVVLSSDDSFNFSLDASDYNGDLSSSGSKNAHRQVGEIKNTKIYLEELVYNDRGLNVNILYEPEEPDQTIQLASAIPKQHGLNDDLPLLVSAVNEDGEVGELLQSGSGPGKLDEGYGFTLNKSFIQSSEQIDITIENLPYKILINDSIEAPISVEGGK